MTPAAVLLESVLTCPRCGFSQQETMLVDACQFFYECGGCQALLRPHPGHCCVFCSYGSVPCPPVQQPATCCQDEHEGLPKSLSGGRDSEQSGTIRYE